MLRPVRLTFHGHQHPVPWDADVHGMSGVPVTSLTKPLGTRWEKDHQDADKQCKFNSEEQEGSTSHTEDGHHQAEGQAITNIISIKIKINSFN